MERGKEIILKVKMKERDAGMGNKKDDQKRSEYEARIYEALCTRDQIKHCLIYGAITMISLLITRRHYRCASNCLVDVITKPRLSTPD